MAKSKIIVNILKPKDIDIPYGYVYTDPDKVALIDDKAINMYYKEVASISVDIEELNDKHKFLKNIDFKGKKMERGYIVKIKEKHNSTYFFMMMIS